MLANTRSRPFTRVLWVIPLLLVTFLPLNSVHAYRSLPNNAQYPKLPGSATSLWIFYNYLDTKLGISGSATHATHALNQWNTASSYTMFDIPDGGATNTKTSNTIIATNFQSGYGTTCGNLSGLTSDIAGYSCPVDRNIF